MIQIESVRQNFPGLSRPALDGVTLQIPDHQTTVLLGPSGSGKSTLLKTINGLLRPNEGWYDPATSNIEGQIT